MKRIALFLLIVALALNAIPALAASTTLVRLSITGGSFDPATARSMLAMVNALRTGKDAWYWDSSNTNRIQASGLKALKYDYGLERVAMQRAAELALAYSHNRPNGEQCFTAYPDVLRKSIAENIAYGFTSAKAVFTAWSEADEPYNGQGHRRNMLSANYTTIGIGCYECNGILYWVQEFSSASSGDKDVQPTLPVEVEALESLLSQKTIGANPVALAVGESLPCSELEILVDKVPCILSDMTWSSAKPAVAELSQGKVVGKAEGSTTLKGKLGSLSVTVPITVSASGTEDKPGEESDEKPDEPFILTLGGSMMLNPAVRDCFSVDFNAVNGAARYVGTLNILENNYEVEYEFPKAGGYTLDLMLDDYTQPLHCTMRIDALDAKGKLVASTAKAAVLHPSEGTLRLPAGLKRLGSEALTGTNARCIIVPDDCIAIESGAFAQCADLVAITISNPDAVIAEDAFEGCNPDLVISAPADSTAARFAKGRGIAWFELG